MLTRHIQESLQVTPGPFPDFWVGPGDKAKTEPGFTILIRAHLLYSLKSWREELGSGMKRKYPRATLRRIMKSKRNINISKSADLAVSSSYVLFLNS